MGTYTVKQVAAMTGVPETTLRAWERRYQVVSPARTAARYRHYSDDEVTRLKRMAQLVAGGTAASLAAQQVRGRAQPEIPTQRVTDLPGTGDLVDAAAALDSPRLEAVLTDAFSAADFEDVLDAWLFPALTRVGDAWEQGDLDIASEHFVSAAVVRRLAGWFEAQPVADGSPRVLVGLPAGAHHQIATLAFAVCLRRRGIDVGYLSTDVPRPSWLLAVTTARPDACVVGVPTESDAAEAAALADQLAPHTAVYLGGRGSAAVPLCTSTTHLTGSVAGSARDLAESLGGAQPD
ncbi:MAG: MerR family transcriptional regulator [Propioniciclava sp.]